MGPVPRHRSAALPLLVAWIALIVYASLYPFAGWRWPPGASLLELLRLPWPRYWLAFDIGANLAGYFPLGFLVYVALWRRGIALAAAALGALAGGAALAWTLEATQNLLPQRVPSLLDAVINMGGTGLGALAAARCDAVGRLTRWRQTRDRWFSPGSAGATALLLLWPAALLFPAPVPLGLGQIGTPLRHAMAQMLPEAAGLDAMIEWLDRPEGLAPRLPVLVEGFATALGLLAPNLLAAAAVQPERARKRLALGAAVAGTGAMTLSTLLNFGPDHALAWATGADLAAMAAATVVALAAFRLPPARAAAWAVAVLVTLIGLVHAAPSDPYYAQSLQSWEQGRFVRFHGAAQWLGWLWPYAALAWLLARLGAGAFPPRGNP